MENPRHHIFVCTSSRPSGQQKGLCHTKGGVEIMAKLMEEIEERDLRGEAIVTNTSSV
jgi:predicted metal-binding protein